MRREKYRCDLCLGQDGDEALDPSTGEKYCVRVTWALPLKRRLAGSGEWRVEPICEHCAEDIRRAAEAEKGSVRLYPLEKSFQEARRRDSEIIRRNCKTKSIVRHCARFRMDDDPDPTDNGDAATDGGSK